MEMVTKQRGVIEAEGGGRGEGGSAGEEGGRRVWKR